MRADAPRRSNEAGFILLEGVTVAAVMMLVLGMFLGSLDSLTRAETRVQGLVNNEETVRFGVDQMTRELRAANPLDAVATTSDYRNQVRIELGPTPGTHSYIRWLYDTNIASPTYESVLRQVMSGPASNATVLYQGTVIRRVHNVETNAAVFSYRDAHGNDLVSLNPSTPANVANCAIAVHIQLNSDAAPGPQPFSENVDVELRNRLPGGILGCAG